MKRGKAEGKAAEERGKSLRSNQQGGEKTWRRDKFSPFSS
jgi:hypothetical protein